MDEKLIPRVDVVYLTYNCERLQPSISLDNVCTISLYELRKHREAKKNQQTKMSIDAYKHYKWYNSVLTDLLKSRGGPESMLKTFHWYIESSNVEAFKAKGVLFEAVSLIICEELEHWYCAKQNESLHGSRIRISNSPSDCESVRRAKVRLIDCMNSPEVPRATSRNQRNGCPRRLSLGTIIEE
ncbi:uncharacterized protein LOC129764757 [Toxorhynchites rutilus septentrionalis]|uniref:uncharacterized protein LOC129764757 n=1 Tax=Toxorhynchites rutilus septentrionalis TaxID=329112 RepID=UPI002478EAAC|nr:uncharacterized protein LOC129764757 [Toxorhynchites rutilus septentrionalis]